MRLQSQRPGGPLFLAGRIAGSQVAAGFMVPHQCDVWRATGGVVV